MKKQELPITDNHAGDIVVSKYRDINGDDKVGIFCILYLERYDTNIECANNVVCVKVTTKYHPKYKYYVDLPKEVANIQENSRICPSKLYTIKYTDIHKRIGRLNKDVLKQVLDNFTLWSDNAKKQMNFQIGFLENIVERSI